MTYQLIKRHNFDMVFDSQKVSRLIIDSVSNPATIVDISEYGKKLYGGYPEFLAVAMTLLDTEVSFHVCGSKSLTDEIVSLTLAKREKIEAADFIFVCDRSHLEHAIENSKCGTLADPHKSAVILIRNVGAPSCHLTFSGPGIDGKADIKTTKTVKEAITMRNTQCYEYPQGIEFLFISDAGEMFAIPRLTRMEVR